MRLKRNLSLCPHKPVHASTHLKWFMGILVFSTLPCGDFPIFYFLFSFLPVYKTHKNANKRISYFFPLRCFLSAFLILFAYLRFCAFCALVFLVCAKPFCKKK